MIIIILITSVSALIMGILVIVFTLIHINMLISMSIGTVVITAVTLIIVTVIICIATMALASFIIISVRMTTIKST